MRGATGILVPENPAGVSARQRILSAAARLYAVRGYAGTSMRAVADAAQVTKPLVYYHFGSKQHLFATLLREAIGACRDLAQEVQAQDMTAHQRLASIVGSQFAQARRAPEVVAFAHEVLTMPGYLPLGFDYKSEGRALFEAYVTLVQDGQRRGEFRDLDARAVVVAIMATVSMYVAAVLSGELKEIPAQAEDTVLEIVTRGVMA